MGLKQCSGGKSVPVENLDANFADVWRSRAEKWTANLDAESLLVIAAYAITGQAVQVSDVLDVGSETRSWRKLADSGICMLEPIVDDPRYRVVVPYCAFRHCGQIANLTARSLPLPHRYLSKCLRYMLKHVDKRVYDCEPWQLWETFGACFHAARINSFQVLGVTQVNASRLFQGGIGSSGSIKVKLRPMKVFRSSDQLSNELGTKVRETGNTNHSRSWIGPDEDETGVIVINGAGGKGVDVFFSFPIAHSETSECTDYVLFLDQRKRVATDTMSASTAKGLIAKACEVYRHDGPTVVGLFSMFPRTEIPASDLPSNSFVISKKQTKTFHGGFWSHPAACPYVDIQEDNKTTLCLLLEGTNDKKKEAAADEIIAKRTSNDTVSDMAKLSALAKRHDLTLVKDAAVWAVI
jgi:hypothetical protein